MNRRYRKPVEKVLAKQPLFHSLFKITTSGNQDTNIHTPRPGGADA